MIEKEIEDDIEKEEALDIATITGSSNLFITINTERGLSARSI